MTLPSSFPLSASQINVELGRAGGAPFSISGAEERALAGVPSGAISFSDFLGKSNINVELVHTSASESEVANYGTDGAGRWIVVLAIGGNDNNPYSLDATISGVLADVIIRHSSGTGGGVATGTAILVGQPSGTSGTVTVSGCNGSMRFFVLRVTGYDLSAAVDTATSTGAGIPPWDMNVPAGGFTLAINHSSGPGPDPLSWTGLTERIPDIVLIGGPASVAWDTEMASDPSKTISTTHSDVDGDTSAVIATFNPS